MRELETRKNPLENEREFEFGLYGGSLTLAIAHSLKENFFHLVYHVRKMPHKHIYIEDDSSFGVEGLLS